MRVAPRGKWFIQAIDDRTGKKFFPFYDGFNTKNEAQSICEKLRDAQSGYTYEVIRK